MITRSSRALTSSRASRQSFRVVSVGFVSFVRSFVSRSLDAPLGRRARGRAATASAGSRRARARARRRAGATRARRRHRGRAATGRASACGLQ